MGDMHLRRHSKMVFSDKRFLGSNGEAWWYEEPQGICIIHEMYVQGVRNRTDELWIPWARIRSALKRLDRAAQGDDHENKEAKNE